jgi:hypothetical protein
LLCLAASELVIAASPDNPARPDVIVAARTAQRSTYFPTVERLRNGDLIVVYYDSPDHVSEAGRIALVRSSDDGRTWSAPRVIVDTMFDDRDPSIMQTSWGTLLLTFFVRDWNQSPARALGVYVTRSDDGGVTWEPPVKVETRFARTVTPGGAATSAKIVELENGDLLIPLYGALPDNDDKRATIVRSTDRGHTWPRANEVEIGYRPGIDLVEPALANLGHNRLLAKMRTERTDNLAYEAHSLDGGFTWSQPTKTVFAAQASDLLPLRVNGRSTALVLHAWGDFSSRFGLGRPTVVEIEDPEATWRFPGPKVVYHGGCSWGDESYPSAVLLSDGRVFMVYYDACRGFIGGTYLTLLDLAKLGTPSAPTDLTASVAGSTVTLRWTVAGGGNFPTSYVVEAGSSPGSADLARLDTANVATSFTATSVPPRTYFVRVRARNAGGDSGPSNEVTLTVGGR